MYEARLGNEGQGKARAKSKQGKASVGEVQGKAGGGPK